MTYTPTNWVDGATPLNRTNMMKIENELALLDGPSGSSFPIPLSTTLPGSPVDGQEVILVNSLTAPTFFWHMRYVAASTWAEKWIFVGGAPLQGYVAGSGATSIGWNPATPSVSVPFNGAYTFAAQAVFNPTVVGTFGVSGWHDGALDGDWQSTSSLPAGGFFAVTTNGVGKLLTLADTLSIALYANQGGNVSNRMISLLPVRLR